MLHCLSAARLHGIVAKELREILFTFMRRNDLCPGCASQEARHVHNDLTPFWCVEVVSNSIFANQPVFATADGGDRSSAEGQELRDSDMPASA